MKSESRKWMADPPPDYGKVWGWARLNPAGKTGPASFFILCPMGTLIEADSCNMWAVNDFHFDQRVDFQRSKFYEADRQSAFDGEIFMVGKNEFLFCSKREQEVPANLE